MDSRAFEEQPPPAGASHERDPADVLPADSYQLGEPVWVYRHDRWHRGVVEGSSARAVLVRYQPGGQRGQVTDTVTANHVAPRTTAHSLREEDRR